MLVVVDSVGKLISLPELAGRYYHDAIYVSIILQLLTMFSDRYHYNTELQSRDDGRACVTPQSIACNATFVWPQLSNHSEHACFGSLDLCLPTNWSTTVLFCPCPMRRFWLLTLLVPVYLVYLFWTMVLAPWIFTPTEQVGVLCCPTDCKNVGFARFLLSKTHRFGVIMHRKPKRTSATDSGWPV